MLQGRRRRRTILLQCAIVREVTWRTSTG